MTTKRLSRKLLHKITFLENKAAGSVEPDDWQPRLLTYAEVAPLYDNSFSSLENMNFGHVITESYFVFRLRFSRDIDTKLRIKFKERIFEVKRVINLYEQDRILKIIALEV